MTLPVPEVPWAWIAGEPTSINKTPRGPAVSATCSCAALGVATRTSLLPPSIVTYDESRDETGRTPSRASREGTKRHPHDPTILVHRFLIPTLRESHISHEVESEAHYKQEAAGGRQSSDGRGHSGRGAAPPHEGPSPISPYARRHRDESADGAPPCPLPV